MIESTLDKRVKKTTHSETRRAVIIGAGPAGLTAAYELLTRTDILPVVIEKSTYMGGISRTLNYKGNRMDIGGHRFFSKSDRVMQWWLQILPLENTDAANHLITYQGSTREVVAEPRAQASNHDSVMLVRRRKSRIYFLRKFFEYPIRLSKETLFKLGFFRTVRIGLSYMRAVLFPIRNVRNLEQFFINRFGRELYLTFFKSYTEKVWGVPCQEISSEWGEQRIKGLSVAKTLAHVIKRRLQKRRDIAQKTTETSLIEQFLYPKFGPGQMWEEVARRIISMGGEILTGFEVQGISVDETGRVTSVSAVNEANGHIQRFSGDYFFSTMPIQELVRSLETPVPPEIREISEGLMYRDFITVGILLNKLKVSDRDSHTSRLIKDNWIYIQEPDVLAGRLQIFNNWSPFMVADQQKVWLGVEYFCYETDPIWRKSDREMASLAIAELDKIGIIDKGEVLDWTVFRMPKTYPAYFGSYARFSELRAYLDQIKNLFLVGRNGMHKYNNQDHSMLTAMIAVDNIIAESTDKSNLWSVNTETEYHETKSSEPQAEVKAQVQSAAR